MPGVAVIAIVGIAGVLIGMNMRGSGDYKYVFSFSTLILRSRIMTGHGLYRFPY